MATLEILTLHCNRQEDWTGDDDIYITINGGSEINMGRFDDNQGRDYKDKVFSFDSRAIIRLYEHDKADPDDFLGFHEVTSDEVGRGESPPVNFSNMGASYDLVYRVTGTEAETTSQALVTSESKSGGSGSSGSSGGHDKPPKHKR